MKITRLSDSFFQYMKRGHFGIVMFWSTDWMKKDPWTYEGQYTPYFSKKEYERDIGYMTSYFIGPLLVVYYKMKK